jgi:hypothetical protein
MVRAGHSFVFRKAAMSRSAAGRTRVSTASISSSDGSANDWRNARSASSSSTTMTGRRYVPSAAVAMSRSARSSASFFHLRSTSTVKRASSVSISLAHSSHNQIPLLAARRSSGVRERSYLLPPGAAAVICAASPTLTDLFSSKAGPEVGRRHCGLEQWWPARLASVRIVAAGKSSRFVIINQRKSSPR